MWIISLGGLAQYSPLWISFQNRSTQCAVEWKPRSLYARRYVAHSIDLNEYLASFLGATLTEKLVVTELNKIPLNIMPNIWFKQAYVQGFDCESITLKKYVNMFERMGNSEYIYKGVV